MEHLENAFVPQEVVGTIVENLEKTPREKSFEVEVFSNKVAINVHPFNPNRSGNYVCPWTLGKSKVFKSEYTPTREYKRTLKRARKMLFGLDLQYDKMKFLTLGTNEEMTWKEIVARCKSFINKLKNEYEGINYIRTIEHYQNGTNNYHIHIIVIFKDKAPVLNRDWLKEHWQYGHVDVKNGIKNREVGVIEYITLFKTSNLQQDNLYLTKYPSNARFIVFSKNLLKEKKEMSYKMNWTEEQYNSFMNEVKSTNGQVFYDGHYYDKDKYCLDKVYIHDADIIDNI